MLKHRQDEDIVSTAAKVAVGNRKKYIYTKSDHELTNRDNTTAKFRNY